MKRHQVTRDIDKLYLPVGTKLFLVDPRTKDYIYTGGANSQRIFAMYLGNKKIRDYTGIEGRVSKVAFVNFNRCNTTTYKPATHHNKFVPGYFAWVIEGRTSFDYPGEPLTLGELWNHIYTPND